jgi:hypothetical protein
VNRRFVASPQPLSPPQFTCVTLPKSPWCPRPPSHGTGQSFVSATYLHSNRKRGSGLQFHLSAPRFFHINDHRLMLSPRNYLIMWCRIYTVISASCKQRIIKPHATMANSAPFSTGIHSSLTSPIAEALIPTTPTRYRYCIHYLIQFWLPYMCSLPRTHVFPCHVFSDHHTSSCNSLSPTSRTPFPLLHPPLGRRRTHSTTA